MTFRRLVPVAVVAVMALGGCSDKYESNTSSSATGVTSAAAGQGGRPPATPPSTSAPVEISNRTLRINVSACSTGSCEVVQQVSGLPSVGGEVSVVVVRNDDKGVVTDNVVVLDRIGKQLWAAPSAIPSAVGKSVVMFLDGSGNILLPTPTGTGSRVYVIGVTAKEIKDFGSFGADSPFISEAVFDVNDLDGDGSREIRVTKAGTTTRYLWNGGIYSPAPTPTN